MFRCTYHHRRKKKERRIVFLSESVCVRACVCVRFERERYRPISFFSLTKSWELSFFLLKERTFTPRSSSQHPKPKCPFLLTIFFFFSLQRYRCAKGYNNRYKKLTLRNKAFLLLVIRLSVVQGHQIYPNLLPWTLFMEPRLGPYGLEKHCSLQKCSRVGQNYPACLFNHRKILIHDTQ